MPLPIRTTNEQSEVARLLAHAAFMVSATMDHYGLTQAELARRTGQTQQGIGRILRGDFGMTLRTLARLAFAMGYRVQLTFERL